MSISSGIQLSLIVCEIDLMVVSIFKRPQGNRATRWISAAVYVFMDQTHTRAQRAASTPLIWSSPSTAACSPSAPR